MKAESGQFPQKLATRLKFAYCFPLEITHVCDDECFSLAFVIANVCYLQRKSVFVRQLPNADFLGSDWFARLWEGQPFSFENISVMSL